LTELHTAMFELEAGRPRRFCFSDFIDWWSRGNFGEEASMWPFHSCTCSATEAVSPPGSPSRRNRGPATSTAQTLLARARESAKGAVEVVQVRDEISEVEQISSSSLVGKNTNKPPVSMDLDNNGSRSVKNSVRWEVQEVDPDDLGEGLGSASPKSQKSQKSLEKAERTQKKRKTLHTWLSAMLDVSEGGLDTVTVPEGGSPCSYVRSHSRSLHPPSVGGLSPSSRSPRNRGWRSPGSATSSPAKSIATPTGASGQPSILWLLRDHFVNNVDADGSGHLSRDDLFEHIKENLEEEETLSAADIDLLREVEQCRFSEMDLGLGGEALGMAEWLHFMLLRASTPSHVAAKHLNRHLRKALEEDSEVLGRIHAAFEYADSQGDGLIRQDKWPEAFEVVGLGQPPDEILEDREEDGSPWALSYYEFVAHALGLKATVVELALYDLSQGVAQWVPSALLGGYKVDGVWHSGLRVFGKEFWYGGVILESNYSDVPFGEPAAVIRLGSTLRSYEDLVEFLKEDVYVDYNPRMYDVLRRNCNHFSNELAQFLLHGKQLPEEVLMQPEWLKDAALVRTMRPLLNRWLGGFGDALSGGEDSTPQAVSRIDDLTEEWRYRLQANDLVMHRTRFIDRPRAVRILSIVNDENGNRVAEVKFFKPSAADGPSSAGELLSFSWEVVHSSGVPLRQFYPLLEEEHGCAHILRAGLAIRDEAARAVLQRPRSTRMPPQCPKGHFLKPAEAKWLSFVQPKSCSVCHNVLGTYEVAHSCTHCDFVLCSSCRDAAPGFPGGGAFSDVLTPDLARALLGNEDWLCYKAQVYFVKADHNSMGFLDKQKTRRVDNRLAAELGVKPLGDSELIQALKEASGSLELSESAFQHFFSTAVSRGLSRLEAGKLWRPKRRGSRR